MKTLGVDVSHWEGFIDWSVAYRWLPFVYYKCTEGTGFVDPTFAANKQGCVDFGIPHAPYHWYKPAKDAEDQAAHFVSTAGEGYKRLIYDVEEKPVNSYDLHTSLLRAEQLSGGIRPAIYTNTDTWNAYVKPFPSWSKDYDLIIASYTLDRSPFIPTGWNTWVIWQFSKYFYIPGCNETADGNWFNGDLVACRDWFGNFRPLEREVDPPVYNHTKLRSQFNGLHIRKSPSINSKELGHLVKNEVVELNELGGNDAWVHHVRGWTAVERSGYRYMEVVK